MKKLIAISIFCLLAITLKSQYGNSWINYSQQYVKFPIAKDGIYRIDSLTLSSHYDLNTVNPQNFQLFVKGQEQALYIKGEADGKINSGDYIEFYGSAAMGDVDSLLYWNIKYVPNPYLPIFNDTIYGFLTVNNSLNNKRYVLETDTNSALYPLSPYFYAEKIFTQKSVALYPYNRVEEYASDASDPRYTQAEGFGFNFGKGGNVSTSFNNLNTYTASSLPGFVTLSYSGNSKNSTVLIDHQVQFFYKDQNAANVLLHDTVFRGFVPVKRTFTLNPVNAANTNFTLTSVASPSFATFSNNTLLHYIHYFYPHNADLNNQPFQKLFIDNSTSSQKSYFNFSNFNFSASSSVLLYDITNNKRITTKISGTTLGAVIPNGTGRKLCILSAESQTINIGSLIKVNNQSGTFTNYLSMGGSKPYIIIYHNKIKTGALLYQNYRQTISGGGYNTIGADIDELYEQFGYGVNKHPVSINNFARYLNDNLPSKPLYFFLIGKSIESAYLTPSDKSNLIPTMGIPSCDNLLMANLTPTTSNWLVPELPIGRLSALTNSEVVVYLTKVQQHESSLPAEWKKKVLHFVGGDEANLTNLLTSYMNMYENVIKDTLFGANVLTFKKNTTAPIQINISDSIKNTISNGAALINFFGHGSEQGFDQAIDDPEVYNNTGRYPFIIANACYSGNIHVEGRRSLSERFVFSNQKGSIGFLAATSLGFIHALHNYTSGFYQALSRTKYNAGIGDIIKEAVFKNSQAADSIIRFTGLDMTLHGDPAIKITNGILPDYQIKNSSVVFNTKKYSDSIGVTIHITNLGKAVRDSFIVKVERFYPNGDSAVILKTKRAPMYKDSLSFFTLIDFNRGIGLNKFKVQIDAYNEIGESIETNNSTIGTVDVFIQGGDIMPVYPYKFAVVPKTNSITLKASTTDPFAPIGTYRFQLDTCDKFTSPIQNTLITSKGGVLEWVVNLPFKDSTVYFWRVSRDSTLPTTPFAWRESSFQTITTQRGWSQAHFHQFKNDAYQFVNYKKTQRKFVFENTKNSLFVRNFFQNSVNLFSNLNYFYNNITMANWGCGPNGWNIAVFDSISAKPQYVKSLNFPTPGVGPFNSCACVDYPLPYYAFGANNYCNTTTWKADLESFLNSISPNNYVLAYTVGEVAPGYAQISTYNNSLYNAFESIGAVSIRNTSDTVPYILFGRKGMLAGQGNEVKGINKSSIITLTDSIKTNWNSGYIASELIGPSFKWKSLHWRVQSLETSVADTTVIKVVGYKNNGQADTLAVFDENNQDILNLENYADAAVYPYLKLVAFMKDNVKRTSPQLKRWQVLYDEAPECAINPLKGFQSINDTLQEGDEVTFTFPIENIGVKNFTDSLVITYWIEDKDRNKNPLPQKMKSKPFVPGQLFIDTVKVNTYQFTGNNSLWLFVNPIGNSRYQKEQHQFNNIGRYGFKVSKDVTNPLLDVTFDGIRILNGDIVSAKPTILITLKDENQFLKLNDTSAFTLLLQAPNSPSQKPVYFGQGLQFIPANLPKNSCSIIYTPVLPVDGKYKLIVQAKDRSNNRSGVQSYEIQFEINNKPSITNILNYPNPFSTSTKFVFTLTGSEVPEVFTIQIMTISGKLVREITRAELGPLHIGRNITEYSWDGRDDFGDKLANGVYLYKVVNKLNGENIEKSGTSADKFFVKEFGKMVIMR